MNKKRRGKAVAVIDIGSSLIQMRVSQLCDGAITDIDVLRYPTQIGHEVFSTGKISFDSLKEMISVLRGYAQVMLEYGVTQYKVVATSVLREAKNRAYVVDQIKIQNDMAIEVLEDDQEKTLIYSVINSESKRELLPLIRSIDEHAFINVVKTEELDGRFHDIPHD